jgi:glycosyltransferase involved in cell wall biosynthesis
MSRPTSNSRPVLSFGLPVRNGAPTIAQAIESVLAQTFDDWELVISDNLSTDGTSDICSEFAARDSRVRHVRAGRDLPLLENFRESFRLARGTYFRWQGDDDWLEPEYAERAVAALAASPSSVLCTTVQRYYRDERPLPINDPIPVLGGVDSTDPADRVRALLRLFQDGGHLGIDPVYSLVRRDVAAKTRLQGSIRDGDFVYSCEVALLGPYVHLPEVLANRRLVGAARGTPASKTLVGKPAWHRFVQREVSILQVAGASRGLPVASRVRIGAALGRFAIREHAHGVRRRARRLASRL